MAVNLTAPGPDRKEQAFSRLVKAAALAVVLTLAAVAFFLVWQSLPALFQKPGEAALTPNGFVAYAAPLLLGTLWVSALALLLAVPLAVMVALYLTCYAPPRAAKPLAFLIDLLAAVPSVVYGLWGITVLAPAMVPLYQWLNQHLGWVPLFGGVVSGTGRTILTAALVLALMVLPLITALAREVFAGSPQSVREGALALGATRWEMVRLAILPPAKPGILSSVLLGLGRALGETMAVAMVLSATGILSWNLLTSQNPSTIAANIALNFPEAFGLDVSVLIATGLALFITTFAINAAARRIVRRGSANVTKGPKQ